MEIHCLEGTLHSYNCSCCLWSLLGLHVVLTIATLLTYFCTARMIQDNNVACQNNNLHVVHKEIVIAINTD